MTGILNLIAQLGPILALFVNLKFVLKCLDTLQDPTEYQPVS